MDRPISPGLQALEHIVVLMLSGRSFDHMLGSLKKSNPAIDGLSGTENNPDTMGAPVRVTPDAHFQGQLDPVPDDHFSAVDLQIFGSATTTQDLNRKPNMTGFVKSYYNQQPSLVHSHKVMSYFTPDKLPVLTGLAQEFAVFNRWFSSVPGPPECNRSFAHYGTSFGCVTRDKFYPAKQYPSIYERLVRSGRTTKCYRYDTATESLKTEARSDTRHLAESFPEVFGTFADFLNDCARNRLPDHCFIAPNYFDHQALDGSGVLLATDQYPDHDVRAGEQFIASIYNAIRNNPSLWLHTALLITYDTHGGLFDHVPPPACTPDGFVAQPAMTGSPDPFHFDRLGVRVPAILVSPWIAKGTVINDTFEHASIPATVWDHFSSEPQNRSPREIHANTFLNYLNLSTFRAERECPIFVVDTLPHARSNRGKSDSLDAGKKIAQRKAKARPVSIASATEIDTSPSPQTNSSESASSPPQRIKVMAGPSTHVARDRWTVEDSLGYFPYAYAIYRFLTDPDTVPPLAVSIQAPWGGGKTSLMRMVQSQLDPKAIETIDVPEPQAQMNAGSARVKHVLDQLKEATADRALPQDQVRSSKHSIQPNPSESTANTGKNEGTIPPIDRPGERRRTVWFNAWKYESTAQVWAGLADCIIQQISGQLGPVERELFWLKLQLRRLDASKIRRKVHEEIFSSFLTKLLVWLPAYAVGLGLLGVTLVKHAWLPASAVFSVEVLSAWGQFLKAKTNTENQPARISLGDFVHAPDYSANLGFVHEVADDLRHIFHLIPKKDLPLVIFIDDLDRCSPGKISAVVEAINLFLAGEFPQCMFILGIDDEMVAAALDRAHDDVIAKLPRYVRSTSIGWRFMDKFVQLPFTIPSPTPDTLARYVGSLLSHGDQRAALTMQARDSAARIVEAGSPASPSPEQVVAQVTSKQPLAHEEQENLKRDVEIVQGMDDSIREFNDQDSGIRNLITNYANRYFNNPRDMKRFVNLFRFYYFLRAARMGLGQPVATVDQLCRWLAFSLKWPEVGRWLRGRPIPQRGSYTSPFEALEYFSERHRVFRKWQDVMNAAFDLKAEETAWLQDEDLHHFLGREIAEFAKEERLSSCSDKGLW